MKMSGGPGSVNIKIILLFIAAGIVAGILFYTHNLVKELQEKERKVVKLFAKGLEYVANSSDESSDITFLFENIIQPIDFPLILTDADNNVNVKSRSDIRNIELDSTLSEDAMLKYLSDLINTMDAANPPIPVYYVVGKDSILFSKIHYGDSKSITQLKLYPYVLLAIAAIFILVSYIGFSMIKKSEQSNIWVGMSKETAHQFGTPISSLMGWIEILKMHYDDKDKVLDTAHEIENDVEKLNKITNRFSKIGSKPELKAENLSFALDKVVSYFNRRLPQSGKKVNLAINCPNDITVLINVDLFEWVIENLIKNALDAIDHDNGLVEINVFRNKKMVEIEVTDNGKGIEIKRRKDIFRPGYSTKRRGWGLGLSLSKRIIEGYHHGKIFVKSSVPWVATTFKIILKGA